MNERNVVHPHSSRTASTLKIWIEGEDGRGMDSELSKLRLTFSRNYNYLIWALGAKLILKGLNIFPLINHNERKLNVLLRFEHS